MENISTCKCIYGTRKRIAIKNYGGWQVQICSESTISRLRAHGTVLLYRMTAGGPMRAGAADSIQQKSAGQFFFTRVRVRVFVLF